MPDIVLDSSHKLHKFLPEKNVNVSKKTTYTRLQPTVSNIVIFLPRPICNMVTMDFKSFIIYSYTFCHIYVFVNFYAIQSSHATCGNTQKIHLLIFLYH